MLQFVFMVRGGDLSTANDFDASQNVSGSLMRLGFSYSRSGPAPACLASGDLEGMSRHSQEDRDFQELDHLFFRTQDTGKFSYPFPSGRFCASLVRKVDD